MKKCPSCSRIFDDLQSFCLEDGSPLLIVPATNSQETVVLPRRKNKFPFVLGGLLLAGVLVIGGWLLLGSRANDSNQSNRQIAVATQTPVPSPSPTPTETPTPLPSPSPSPTVSPEANSNISANSETKPEISANSKPADESNPAKPLPVIMKAEDHSVLFALHECRKSGSSITCLFSLTNKGQDREFQLWGYRSDLFDELGNGYKGSDAQIANQTGNSPTIGFINGVTTRAQMTFENVEPSATKITLLSIGFDVGNDERLSVKFRNVPLIVSK
ncbi:MAG: hypothetical protein M3Q99_16165 [Acidobacteriota bacterium]|nr:hypothetical protein [Acidobacteriota bacterium]